MSTLMARKLAPRPFWLPRGATEHADFTNGLYFAVRRQRSTLAAWLAASGHTFARASEASFVGADGFIAWASANAPRVDYDPVALTPFGLFLEGSRTNLQLRSSEMDNGWSVSGIAVVADAATAPDGTTTADKVAETAVTNTHACYRGVSMTSGVPYVRSCFAKQAERIWCSLNYDSIYKWFRLSDGTIGASGSGVAAIQPAPNGFFRCSVVVSPGSTASHQIGIRTSTGDNAGSFLGIAGSGIYAWGYQLEQASFPSSPIRTAGSTATRAADILSRTIAQPASLTRVFKVRTAPGVSGNQVIWSIGDATNGALLRRASTGHILLTVFAAGVSVVDLDAGGVGSLGVHTVAIALDGTNARLCLNGGDILSAAAAMPTLTTMIERIGSSAAGEEWFGHIQTVTAFAALGDAEMIARTAPPQYINALIGIDSLSDPRSTGAGRWLADIMKARIGTASAGWVPLIFTSDARVNGLNYTGGAEISHSTGNAGDPFTLDFQGHYWSAPNSTSSGGFFTPKEPYDQCDMIYVSNPGDGSFRFQSTGNGSATVDGDAAPAARKLSVECFTAPNAAVRWDQFEDGNPNTIVGVNFSRAGAGGFTYNPMGNGGWKVQWLAEIDDAAMRTIIGTIRPTHFLFNGGMNDRVDRTAVQFDADCRKVLDNVRAAAPRCKIVIIQSLNPGPTDTSYFASYVPVKQQLAIDYAAQYLDERTINANTATYALASAAGYMQDGVHPTLAFNRDVIAPWLADNVAW
ncbi:hypothetical protein LB518_13695 [Mesorhizobium sp. BR1-1-16]|uniref:phage head spike fiber domain-containing protein n=1 Tax=Mesorhizobium sp. BR1-1-16 TaxID=2876653 RepID=UPI001CC94BEF|nr:hypothetical protein [Mesorhizobium sp. BR1-1-16]MBZ9937353.1 hypothetical protein [Mesorhizobium sp. BR1-1-16]